VKTMPKCNKTKSSVLESEGHAPEQSDTHSKTVLFRTNSEGGGVAGGMGEGKSREKNRKEGGRGLNKQK